MTLKPSERIPIPPGFWASLRGLGIAAGDVLRQASLPIDPASGSDAAIEVTVDQYYAVWQAYSDLVGDAAQAVIQLATVFETAQYPPTVLASYHARDFRDALRRMARYKQLCPPESLRVAEEGETCALELEWGNAERPGPPILVGTTLAALLEFGRRGTGRPLTAKLVEVTHSANLGDVRALEAYFGCRVRTGAEANRLTLLRRDLDRPFVSHNAELLEILTPALDRMLDERRRSRSLPETVKGLLKRKLSGRKPDVQSVAEEMGMSDRTLQRRLAEEGSSFKSLLASARHEKAREYLADPSVDIKEVAYRVGYEDLNSFYRAFRQWEGDTPANWRLEHGGTSNPFGA
ncbi:AraC family transcriptional regulator ligand-binding domain-containing protein [Cohnella xylanilytica]|uniref:AraC family transcriptional regulator ligand-binding domain-containing protein n=1 Tax=Cohnella xylanilytica TaxID=557555 RepID=A0A841TZ35_9BACL|nr:AraC family transcriptional regulator [Cohnella xylanilytica]MBB6692809.1 AraC family transcriptional regulator ligand-binding domain-containing protein [Cohnella xylanilytica]